MLNNYDIIFLCAIFVVIGYIAYNFRIPEPKRPYRPKSRFPLSKYFYWYWRNWLWKKWYYLYYLHTWHWGKVRSAVLKRDNYCCRECKYRSDKNHVHHSPKAYQLLFRELEGNNLRLLWTLCRNCHNREHGR